MKRFIIAVGLTFLMLSLGSCGSGGGGVGQGSGSNSTSSTVTSVSVSCDPTSVQNGQTSQCSATVTGTGSYSSAVTWSTDFGTIDTTGKYTAPTSGTGTASVKAVSQQDGTKSGSATVTVTAQTSQTALSPTGPMAVPSILVSGQQTQTTITAFVQGSDANTQVQLFSLVGGTPTLIGNMNDNGQNGDQTAGDHLYTIVTALTPPAATSLPLQVVATEGTASSQNVDFSVPLIQIPTYASNTEVNQAESQIYNTAIQTRTTFPTMDWTSSSQQQTFVNNLTSMLSQLVGVAEQNTALQAAVQLRQSNLLYSKRSTTPHRKGLILSVLSAFFPGLGGAAQNAESCDQLIDSIPGNPDYGSTSYPFSTLSPEDPNMQAFASAMATASQGLFVPDDFLTNDSSSYNAYVWAADYLVTHQLSPAIGGCGTGIAQSVASVAVTSGIGQFTDLAGNALSDLVGGGEISQQLIGQANDTLVGWAADSSGKSTVVIGQAGANQTFAAPAGNYNLAASFGGDTANGTITNTPVYSNTTTIVNPSPGANITVTPPYVTSLTPSLGPVGTAVLIGGSGFDTTPSGNQVTFNGTAAQVSASTASSIQTSVPAGATSGPVTVATSSGSTTSSLAFTVGAVTGNPVPGISYLSPSSASAGSASLALTINGNGFVSSSSVSFGGTARATTFVSSTQLTIGLSATDLATAGTFPVSVMNPSPGGGSSNVVNFTVSSGTNGQIETTLYNFTGPPSDGEYPEARLIMDSAGNLYGTTNVGGDGTACSYGCGTVFELVNSSGTYSEKVLYSFTGSGGDGEFPRTGLTMDASGNLYGTTWEGGANGFGTVFELVKSSVGYAEDILYSFKGSSAGDGAQPQGGLIEDAAGNLYAATDSGGGSVGCGGSGCGIVFELVKSSQGYTENVLYRFGSISNDAEDPFGRLLSDGAGDLYGIAQEGGTYGGGAVFELVKSSGGFTEDVLYSLNAPGTEEYTGSGGGLISDASGNLYGTFYKGGTSGHGFVFELTKSSGGFTGNVLYSFSGGTSDGASPEGALAIDSSGNLYGTTSIGGTFGIGTVFELANNSGSYTENVLLSFGGSIDGAFPLAGLIAGSGNYLYGTTEGESYGFGTVFEISTGATTAP